MMLRIFAFQFPPDDAPLPTAAERASCSASSSPTRRCADVPLISLFHLPKPRGIRATVWHLSQDGSGSQLKKIE